MLDEKYIKLPRGNFFMGTDDENAPDKRKATS